MRATSVGGTGDPRSLSILFLGLNYAPEQVGIGPYSADLTRWLAARGHRVEAVVARPYYPGWTTAPAWRGVHWRRAEEAGVRLLRCPLYVPSQPSGAKRILHHASFAAATLAPMLRRARWLRPDLVMTVAPSLIAAPVARLAAAACGAASWLHVQDFEMEAAFATGLVASDGVAARAARWFEDRVLRGFDRVSTISPAMRAKLVAKGVVADRAVELRNWADMEAVTPLTQPSPYRALWDVRTPHVALYSGNIANKQGIELVLEAATALRDRTDLTFVVCGEGPNRARLVSAAAGLPNIRFHDLQPRERLGELLGLATVHLLPQLAGAADLVLPSKLTNMLASGRPVVATAAAGTGLALEIEGCGVVTPPGDGRAFADAIVRLIDAPARRATLGDQARRRAERVWGKEAILAELETQMHRLVAAPAPHPSYSPD